jgi:hypothetical protein
MTIDPRPGGFDSELSIQARTATTWTLIAPLIWTGTKGDTFTVPIGFVTDFATIPRFLHWLVSPYGAYTRAAVLHDWLLVSLAEWQERVNRGEVLAVDGELPEVPPADSHDTDGIFRRVMQDLGVPWSTRWLMWAGVRWGALFNSRRAYGRDFGKDAGKVLGISLVALPVILPGVLGVVISLGIVRALAPFGSRPARQRLAVHSAPADDSAGHP